MVNLTDDHKKVAVWLAEKRDKDGDALWRLSSIAKGTGITADRLWDDDNHTGILADLNDRGICNRAHTSGEPCFGMSMEEAVDVLDMWQQ